MPEDAADHLGSSAERADCTMRPRGSPPRSCTEEKPVQGLQPPAAGPFAGIATGCSPEAGEDLSNNCCVYFFEKEEFIKRSPAFARESNQFILVLPGAG